MQLFLYTSVKENFVIEIILGFFLLLLLRNDVLDIAKHLVPHFAYNSLKLYTFPSNFFTVWTLDQFVLHSAFSCHLFERFTFSIDSSYSHT